METKYRIGAINKRRIAEKTRKRVFTQILLLVFVYGHLILLVQLSRKKERKKEGERRSEKASKER